MSIFTGSTFRFVRLLLSNWSWTNSRFWQAGKSFLSQRLALVDLLIFRIWPADANANNRDVFKHIQRAPDATADPERFIAHAVDLFRRNRFVLFSAFLSLLAQAFLLLLVGLTFTFTGFVLAFFARVLVFTERFCPVFPDRPFRVGTRISQGNR